MCRKCGEAAGLKSHKQWASPWGRRSGGRGARGGQGGQSRCRRGEGLFSNISHNRESTLEKWEKLGCWLQMFVCFSSLFFFSPKIAKFGCVQVLLWQEANRVCLCRIKNIYKDWKRSKWTPGGLSFQCCVLLNYNINIKLKLNMWSLFRFDIENNHCKIIWLTDQSKHYSQELCNNV